MHQSIITPLASTSLAWPSIPSGFGGGDNIYMLPFKKDNGLPECAAKWQPFVDVMLDGVHTEDDIYLMVDQAYVKGGEPHRRPGVHIDGYWHPSELGNALEVTGTHREIPHHAPVPPRHGPRHGIRAQGDWNDPDFSYPEAILLMSNVQACRAYEGNWTGTIGDGGDCREVDISGLKPVEFEPNRAYAGNVSMLHESLPVPFDCERTVIRLNVPGVTFQ